MKTKKHSLQILETNLSFFRPLLETQSDPSTFNYLVTEIEQRVAIIQRYIKKDGPNATTEELQFAFRLLKEYIDLWELYFKNHPWYSAKEK